MYHQPYCLQNLNFVLGLYFSFAWVFYVCFKVLAAGFTPLKSLPTLIVLKFLTLH